jgi:hypothetical protein
MMSSMFDLISDDKIPTTGMFTKSIMEATITEDIHSLNGHVHGQNLSQSLHRLTFVEDIIGFSTRYQTPWGERRKEVLVRSEMRG